MKPASYQIDLPKNSQAVLFVNGIKAENITGCLWLWRQIIGIKKANLVSEGCKQVKLGICNYREAVIVSYWQDEASLMAFFHSPIHRKMMQKMTSFLVGHPQAISIYNEMYRPLRSGRYYQNPHGLALIYPASPSHSEQKAIVS